MLSVSRDKACAGRRRHMHGRCIAHEGRAGTKEAIRAGYICTLVSWFSTIYLVTKCHGPHDALDLPRRRHAHALFWQWKTLPRTRLNKKDGGTFSRVKGPGIVQKLSEVYISPRDGLQGRATLRFVGVSYTFTDAPACETWRPRRKLNWRLCCCVHYVLGWECSPQPGLRDDLVRNAPRRTII